jgi:hypothetical protein
MTRFANTTIRQASEGARVFADESGKLWSAVVDGAAIVFSCISDARQSERAISADPVVLDDRIDDATLRAWLAQAPRVGMLP